MGARFPMRRPAGHKSTPKHYSPKQMVTITDKEAFYYAVKRQYSHANKEAEKQGKTPPGMPILTESSLRLEQPVNATTTLYTFPVLQGEVAQGANTVFATETRLQTNDNFHIREFAILLIQLTATTDTNGRLKTYPNEVELGAANVNDYFNIYNGILNINVNQVDILTNYDVVKHQFIPQTQRLSVAANSNRDQVDFQYNSFVTLKPSLMLSGAYTNRITLQLPGAVTSAIAGNLTRMVLLFRGIRAQNAALRK